MDRLIYLYGLIPTAEAEENSLPSLKGFDGTSHLYTIQLDEITAIVCNLDSGQYSEDSIQDLINSDMEWLQEKAFHHHETVLHLSTMFTVVPLKFCTLYKNKASLETTVKANEPKMLETFDIISGNEEWNLKIYCQDEVLKKQVSESNPVIEAKRAEISKLPKGRQFFEKKKLEKLVDLQLEEEKNKVCGQIHSDFAELALLANVKRTWSSQVTGRQEKMAWNGVYLVTKYQVEPFRGKIQQYQNFMQERGWLLVATGPWPAYHFSSVS